MKNPHKNKYSRSEGKAHIKINKFTGSKCQVSIKNQTHWKAVQVSQKIHWKTVQGSQKINKYTERQCKSHRKQRKPHRKLTSTLKGN